MARANGNGVVGTAGIMDCMGVMGDALGAGAITGSARDVARVDGPARDVATGLCVALAGVVEGVGTGNKTGIGMCGLDGPAASGAGEEGGVLQDMIELSQRFKPGISH